VREEEERWIAALGDRLPLRRLWSQVSVAEHAEETNILICNAFSIHLILLSFVVLTMGPTLLHCVPTLRSPWQTSARTLGLLLVALDAALSPR
jgi:hypothetical protein